MTRLKVHHLAEAGVPHTQIAEKLDIGLRSVERIVKETGGEAAPREATVHLAHGGGRSRARVAGSRCCPSLTTGQTFRIRAARRSRAHLARIA